MTAMSDYLESQVIQHIFRTSTFTKPTVLAVALCSVAPTDTSTGALTGAELGNTGSYARQAINPLDTNWAQVAGGTGTTSNTPAITFPTASGDWGTVVAVAICDNTTFGAGNLLFYGTLTGTKVVNNGDTFQFSAGQLQVQVDN